LHSILGMLITVDREEVELLREILENTLTQLRFDSARTDTHEYRELLHARERIVEALLVRLGDQPVSHPTLA
jgi:hypothetical protein